MQGQQYRCSRSVPAACWGCGQGHHCLLACFFPWCLRKAALLPQPGLPFLGMINLSCLVRSPEVSSQFCIAPSRIASSGLAPAPLTALPLAVFTSRPAILGLDRWPWPGPLPSARLAAQEHAGLCCRGV